ncbi:hypothetical protein R1flu_016484 [Riccia fluitans]|uniref:F-box/kelch-repeat protein n=1 Tax=Riccia fluitans TaxID=41844 RepID=A0ABD1YM65_9MARC
MLLPLIPGLPDDVVLNHILTRVSWKLFFILPALNRRWREEFQSRRVYEHRRITGTAEQLISVIHLNSSECQESVLSIFSLSEGNAWLRLPRIPAVRRGFPQGCGLVFLEGKLYVLGGCDYAADYDALGSFHGDDELSYLLVPGSAVYELDVASGRGVWKAGAAMRWPRANFSCKVDEGRIHVAGYCVEDNVTMWEVDVYDPVSNSWTVEASQILNLRQMPPRSLVSGGKESIVDKIAWSFTPCASSRSARAFVNGTLYSVSAVGVSVMDNASGEWRRQSISFWDYLRSVGASDIRCWDAMPLDGELLVVVSWTRWLSSERIFALIMSRGLCSGEQNISWNKIQFPNNFGWLEIEHTFLQRAVVNRRARCVVSFSLRAVFQ